MTLVVAATAILLAADRVACGRDGYPLAAGLIIAMMVGFGIAGALL